VSLAETFIWTHPPKTSGQATKRCHIYTYIYICIHRYTSKDISGHLSKYGLSRAESFRSTHLLKTSGQATKRCHIYLHMYIYIHIYIFKEIPGHLSIYGLSRAETFRWTHSLKTSDQATKSCHRCVYSYIHIHSLGLTSEFDTTQMSQLVVATHHLFKFRWRVNPTVAPRADQNSATGLGKLPGTSRESIPVDGFHQKYTVQI